MRAIIYIQKKQNWVYCVTYTYIYDMYMLLFVLADEILFYIFFLGCLSLEEISTTRCWISDWTANLVAKNDFGNRFLTVRLPRERLSVLYQIVGYFGDGFWVGCGGGCLGISFVYSFHIKRFCCSHIACLAIIMPAPWLDQDVSSVSSRLRCSAMCTRSAITGAGMWRRRRRWGRWFRSGVIGEGGLC